jgi:capsular polysaccharide biosynthesis protein
MRSGDDPGTSQLRDRIAGVANGREEHARGGGSGPAATRRLSGDEIFRLCLVAWIIVLIGAAIGFAGSFLLQEQYGARSEVLYSLREDQPTGFLREDRNLTTQVVVIESRTVLAPVALANAMTYEQLAGKVGANVAEGSEIIQIEVLDPNRAEGLRLVDDITARYLVEANGTSEESRRYVERQLAGVDRRLSDPATTPAQRVALAARRADLLDRRDTLALAGPQARQLGASYTTSDPVTPRRTLAAVAGALAGLLIAAVVVILLAHRWRRR